VIFLKERPSNFEGTFLKRMSNQYRENIIWKTDLVPNFTQWYLLICWSSSLCGFWQSVSRNQLFEYDIFSPGKIIVSLQNLFLVYRWTLSLTSTRSSPKMALIFSRNCYTHGLSKCCIFVYLLSHIEWIKMFSYFNST
jgi:hypothetical protein